MSNRVKGMNKPILDSINNRDIILNNFIGLISTTHDELELLPLSKCIIECYNFFNW